MVSGQNASVGNASNEAMGMKMWEVGRSASIARGELHFTRVSLQNVNRSSRSLPQRHSFDYCTFVRHANHTASSQQKKFVNIHTRLTMVGSLIHARSIARPLQWSICWLPHLLLDPFVQVLIVARNVLFLSQTLLHGLFDHRHGNVHADRSRIHHIWQQALLGIFQHWSLCGQGFDGSDKHLIGQESRAAENGTEADAWKAGRVVALSFPHQQSLVR